MCVSKAANDFKSPHFNSFITTSGPLAVGAENCADVIGPGVQIQERGPETHPHPDSIASCKKQWQREKK